MEEFLYLVRNNPDDPYDLEITEYGKIIQDNYKLDKNIKNQQQSSNISNKNQIQLPEVKEYYTVSKKGLCHFINDKPIEFIPLANFIRERETYDEIKS